MAAIIQKLFNLYDIIFVDNIDPRSVDWFLASKPITPLLLLLGYLYFVNKLGPQLMQSRPAFDLKSTLIVYNIVQILTCGSIVIVAFPQILKQNFFCQPVDYSVSEENYLLGRMVHLYYLLKVLDLLDTVFFILRKKFNQASFLHVYHHAGMVIVGFMACKYSLNGHYIMVGAVNSFVHVVMYSYYLLSALWTEYKRNLWWKKYITILQLVQFFFLFIHTSLPLFQPDCEVQRIWCFLLLPQFSFMTFMFGDFYVNTYIKKKPSTE